MTFEEIENTLPNGFHDAKIVQMTLDYPAGVLLMTMEIWIGTMREANQEEYGIAELRANNLYFCFIDPPDPKYPFKPNGKTLGVCGDPEPTDSLALGQLLQKLPEGVKAYRFFADRWNSFIHIAASDVEISWSKKAVKD